MTGSEWVPVLVYGALALGVLGVCIALHRTRVIATRRAVVRGTRVEVLNDLQLAVTSSRDGQVLRDEHALTVLWRYTPGWAIVIAIFLFPIGLVALAAKETETATVLVEDRGDGLVLLRMAGLFSRPSVRAINSVIDARSSGPSPFAAEAQDHASRN